MRGCSLRGMRGCSRGHAWLLSGEGGVCGCSRGAYMVAPGGACMVAPRGGMHGCLGGTCVGYDERLRYDQ